MKVRKNFEDKLQTGVANYMGYFYPEILFMHYPSGGSRNKAEAGKFKGMGVKAGVPDCLIFQPHGNYHGLAVELKWGDNYPTAIQKKRMEDFRNVGWMVKIVYDSVENFAQVVSEYFEDEQYFKIYNRKQRLRTNGKV